MTGDEPSPLAEEDVAVDEALEQVEGWEEALGPLLLVLMKKHLVADWDFVRVYQSTDDRDDSE